MIYVNPIVGKTGLCNMLIPWARAEIFAKRRRAKMLAPQWTNYMRVGQFLRGERSRFYRNEFCNVGCLGGVGRLMKLMMLPHVSERDYKDGTDNVVVDFSGMDGFMEPFFREHDYIVMRLNEIVDPTLLRRAERISETPFVGVHVRRGDFGRAGLCISDEWYVRAINCAREKAPSLPIKIFSDAPASSLSRIASQFDNVQVMPSMPAAQDLLTLSKATILVGTSRSSFSYWAVYLGQMPSIFHPVYKEKPDPLYLDGRDPELVEDNL